MTKTVISVEHLTKRYDLGVIGTGTVSRDLNRWWARMRGRPDPYLKIGQVDHGNRAGESILALDDVSFTVEQGEVLGIIGRNGAGKSTLLKILSQVTAPTSGKVKVKGRIGSLLEVGTGFHPELTGRENVYLNGAILGMSRAEVDRKFDEIVDFSGVEKFIDTPVKRYSSGMYVRLAFAVAAHLEPEILIVDEVLAVGDAEFQKKCLGKMGDVAHEGRTVLFVSHNMGAIKSLCQNGVLIKNGCIFQKGDIDIVTSSYLLHGNEISEPVYINESTSSSTPVITSISIKNENNDVTNSILMGNPFSVEVEFVSQYPVNNPGLGIRINTPSGVTILGCTNEMYPSVIKKHSTEPKRGIFKVQFLSPNLNQGDYTLSFTLSDSGVSIKKYQDVIQMKIIPKPLKNLSKLPSSNQSLIFSDISYHIEVF